MDPKLGDKIEAISNQHFYSNFEFFGNINYDELVYDSVLSKKLFVLQYPYAPASIDLKEIANKIIKARKSGS